MRVLEYSTYSVYTCVSAHIQIYTYTLIPVTSSGPLPSQQGD